MGDHTDYNGGFVLPLAIDRACTVIAVSRPDDRVAAVSVDVPGAVEVAVDGGDDPFDVVPTWGRFVAGSVRALVDRGVRVAAAGPIDLTVRTGPEFLDPSRGAYDVDYVDLRGDALADIDLKPAELKEFILANRAALLAEVGLAP